MAAPNMESGRLTKGPHLMVNTVSAITPLGGFPGLTPPTAPFQSFGGHLRGVLIYMSLERLG